MSSDCDCCAVVASESPDQNRPWLSAVAYRLGTFASFKQAIVGELSRTPELAGLTARVSDDYTITAIELWCAVADVLAFYQERIANEAFLRTATSRDSVLRLVRLIDYQLAAGAAATAQLAFTLEAGATALIPAGTRAQSVPGEGEKPQKFETLDALRADARLNRLRLVPAPVAAAPTSAGGAAAIVAPDAGALAAAAALAPGDRVLLYAPTQVETLTVAELERTDDVLTVRWQAPIASSAFAGAFDAEQTARRAYKLGRSFHLFGFDAPETVVVAGQTNPSDATTAYLAKAKTDFALHAGAGNELALDARYQGLKAGATLLAVATHGSAAHAIPFTIAAIAEVNERREASISASLKVTSQTGTVSQVTLAPLGAQTLAQLLPAGADVRDVVVHELIGEPLRFWPHAYPTVVAARDVFVAGRRNGWSSLEVGREIEGATYKSGTTIDVTDLPARRNVLLRDKSGGAPVAAAIGGASFVGLDIAFAATDADAVTVTKLGLSQGQATPITALVSAKLPDLIALGPLRREIEITIGTSPPQTIPLAGLPPVATRVQIAAALQTAIRAALPTVPAFAQARVFSLPADSMAIVAGTPSDRVEVRPTTEDAATIVTLGLDGARVRWLDGLLSAKLALPVSFAGSVRARVGIDPPVDRAFVLASPASVQSIASAIEAFWGYGAAAREDQRLIVLPPAPAREPRSFLKLSLDLEGSVVLDAATAELLGNVTLASHGETVHEEVLGDGDLSLAFQRFALKKKPLTYVPAAVPGGVASSLTLLVNGERWRQTPTLYGASADEKVYVVRAADDQSATVQFGDGVTGARVPTGRQNVVATYRQGVGLAGRVGAEKISTLLDRPTGVKRVVNPRAADGGADPETMERARAAAPGTVRTFGRAVSLRDFEDTALLAGEVAKAQATWVWAGERRAIHLTVAAQGGAAFSAAGLARVAATLLSERDPNHKVLVDNYAPVAVLVDASIVVDDARVTAEVLAAARAALLAELSFDRREFARPVYLSEVFALLQNVSGVVAVDVNALDLKTRDAAFRAAHGVDPGLGRLQARLLMLPARPVGPAAVLPAEIARVEVPEHDVILRATGGLSP